MNRKLTDPYEIAINFIKYRFRSQLEIEQKLKRKSIPSEEIKKVIQKLKKGKLIDDAEFARLWIRNRISLKPTGSRLLFLELRQKGIESDLAKETIKGEEPRQIEEELAINIARAKYKKFKNLPPFEAKNKLLSFLSRRGFDYSICKKVVESLIAINNF
jgi:regulatory protein